MHYKENFIKTSMEVFGDVYDYMSVNYVNSYTPITLICKEHGSFSVLPKNHIARKQGCPSCNSNKSRYDKRRTTEFNEFLCRANIKHSNKYIYFEDEFKGMRHLTRILCPTHGEFFQEAKFHVKAAVGCKHCYFDKRLEMRLNGGYTLDYFKLYPEEQTKSAILYVVHLVFENNQSCLKVGITTSNAKKRFHTNRKDKIKLLKILAEIPLSLYDAFITEQQILSECYPFRYKSPHKFDGHTECMNHETEVYSILSSYLGINIKDQLVSE